MLDSFKTIEQTTEGLFKDKGSKFIALAIPVISESEIKQELNELHTKYYDARHICYAYRLGFDGSVYRQNDDGEPSGTAGKPIYGQLLSFEVTNVLIAVVRYFGGVKLGVGGLINAYKLAAKDALECSCIIEKPITKRIIITNGYNELNAVMRIIKMHNIDVTNQVLMESCTTYLDVIQSKAAELCKAFNDIYRVNAELEES